MFNRRRIRFAVAVAFALLLIGCSTTPFDRQHRAAVAKNPDGVEMEIRTRDGQTIFAPSATVELEELFTAKFPGYWRIEVNDHWSHAGSLDTAYIWDGRAILTEPRTYSFSCCRSRLVGLDLQPVRIPYEHSAVPMGPNDTFRKITLPAQPGKYKMYVTTWRVFYKDEIDAAPGHQVTSTNILSLEVRN